MCGAYTSLKDANNKIIELWYASDYVGSNYEEASDTMEEDGRTSWEAIEGEGDVTKTWIEKQVLIEETGGEAREWSLERPGGGASGGVSDGESE